MDVWPLFCSKYIVPFGTTMISNGQQEIKNDSLFSAKTVWIYFRWRIVWRKKKLWVCVSWICSFFYKNRKKCCNSKTQKESWKKKRIIISPTAKSMWKNDGYPSKRSIKECGNCLRITEKEGQLSISCTRILSIFFFFIARIETNVHL